MKKGLVLQVEKSTALVLEHGGNFRKVPARKSWKKGDVVRLDVKRGRTDTLRYWTTVAAGCLVMLLAIGYAGYFYLLKPVAYVSIDVNPSVELGLNQLDRVISTDFFNQEGADILESLKLKGMTVENAVQAYLQSDGIKSYLDDNQSVIIGVSAEDRQALLEQRLADVSSKLETLYDDLDLICSGISAQLAEEARSLGVSAGKLALAEELSEEDETLSRDELLEKSATDLLEQKEQLENPESDAEDAEEEEEDAKESASSR